MTSPYDGMPMQELRDPDDLELCRACGAYDIPDANGRCQYCGASLPSAWLNY